MLAKTSKGPEKVGQRKQQVERQEAKSRRWQLNRSHKAV